MEEVQAGTIIRVVTTRTLQGPNIHHHLPVIVAMVATPDAAQIGASAHRELRRRLIELLPGIAEHHCNAGHEGGFIDELDDGTSLAHAVEHVALELSHRAGIGVDYGRTIPTDTPGESMVVVRARSEQAMRYLVEQAASIVRALIDGDEVDLDAILEEAEEIRATTEPGPSTLAIVRAAERRGIPTMRIGGQSLVQLGYGRRRRFVQAAVTDGTSGVGIEIAGDKDLTKQVLERAGVPVPRGEIVRTAEEAIAALERIGGAVVVKPLDGRQGKGVSLGLTTPEEVRFGFEQAQEYSSDVLVEEQIRGSNYRVLVVDGRMVAAAERQPCHVIGDGIHTLGELIDIANQDPRRGVGHEKPLTQIRVDPILEAFLEKERRSLEDIPEAGERVMLCAGMNLSTGGTARDVTDEVHPSYVELCERAARAIGMDICGVDLVAGSVLEPFTVGGGAVIEVNAAPGLRVHICPSEGTSRDVGAAIVDMMFPDQSAARIPLVTITGTNGKTTVTRMIDHILRAEGRATGMTTTDGIWIGGREVMRGDTTGPYSAQVVLSDPTVDVAVLETARGGIMRRGLGYDWSDVGVITNVTADHIGQDGIRSVDDLLHVKSLVAERVRVGGTVVLNADDHRLVALSVHPKLTGRTIVFFSLDPKSTVIAAHVAAGGLAYVLEGNQIVELAADARFRVTTLEHLPITLGGAADFQVANALAAIAATHALGVRPWSAARALGSFRSEVHNPGRMNLYAVGGGYVLIDYGHNPDAFETMSRLASRWTGRRRTGIVGVPGDRDDATIAESGRIVARAFDRVILREDVDLRGRRSGETSEMLCRIIGEESPGVECSVVLDERQALREAVASMEPGEVVILFYEKLEPVLEELTALGAAPADAVR